MTLDDVSTYQPVIPTLSTDRRLLRNDVFELLLERIVSGAFAPGERLKDADLTAWLRVSRTPVREALSRLATVGLVKTAPNRYTLVAPILATEVSGAVAVLRRLYPDAVREAVEVCDCDAELEFGLLTARLERDSDLSPLETFQRLMLVVLASLRNHVLAETIENVHLRVIRYLSLMPEAAGILSRERVLEFGRALCARDRRAVELVEHVLAEADRLLSPAVAAAG